MNKTIYARPCCVLIIMIINLLNTFRVFSQETLITRHDTAYYDTYPSDVLGRIYFSQKYTAVELKNGNNAPRLRYRPNSNLTLGAGFTYKTLTLNFSYGFPFLNPDTEKGKTRSLDLQSRFYGREWAIDFFGQLYKGYFLYPKGRAMADKHQYYLRPDIKVTQTGIAAYKIFNYKRFTLHPAFVQDECQTKSAGSFFAGAEVHYSDFHGDSSLVPSELSLFYLSRQIRRVRVTEIGPGAGYAYTQVLPLHFFITGSVTVNAGLGWTQETELTAKTNHIGVNANFLYRFAAGYCHRKYIVTLFHVNSRLAAKGDAGNRYVLNTGNYRLVIVKRFTPGFRGKRLLIPFDKAGNMINSVL